MMLSDKQILVNMAIEHLEGDGDYLLPSPDDFRVGDDDE